jgi:DNA topoisomerase-1
VNAYIRELTGGDFTAKDFRTWAGTVAATAALTAQPKPAWAAAADRAVVAAVRAVAAELGNTPAVCRKCYIHPAVMDAFRSGTWPAKVSRHPRLSADESRTLALLRNAGSGSRARRNRASHHHVGNGRQSRPA